MTVKAKWNIVYDKTLYKCGDVFEIDEKSLATAFKNDVEVVAVVKKKEEPVKEVKKQGRQKYSNKMLTTDSFNNS